MKIFTFPRDGMNSLILRLLLIAAFASLAMMAQAQATVQTDQLDYAPGSTAIITGSGFQAGETVTLQVLHIDSGVDSLGTDPQYHQPWTVEADVDGNFTTSWHVPTMEEGDALGATLLLTADGQTSMLHAEWTFTDAAAKITAISISSTQSIPVTYGTVTSVTYNITLTPSNDNSAGTTTLSLTGTALPTGTTAIFSNGSGPLVGNVVTLPANSSATIPITLTITNNATTTPAGTTSLITVKASSSPDRTSNTFTYIVNQRPLTITSPTISSKIYDGLTASGTVTVGTLSGFLGTQTVTATATGAYTDANVGTSKPATVTYTLANGANGGLASNYSLANGSGNGDITAKPLTAASTVASKPYDGNATPGAVTLGTVTGLVSGQTLVITPSATNYIDANVGSGKSTTISYALANGTGSASNYSMANLATTGAITAKPLTATSTVASKVYDGSAATGTVSLGSVTGLIGSETLVITPLASNFASANVGTGKTTTITYSLVNGSGLVSNYSMASLATTGAVTAKALSATPTVASKTYNGSTVSGTVTVGALSGLVSPETLTATATGVYPDANVGTGKTATITYTLVNGTGSASNYSLSNGTALGDITPKALSATPTITSKIYDGSTSSGAITVGTLSGLVGSETVTATAAGTYPNANVGTQTATITYTLANGTNGGLATNYSLANGTTSGNITPKSLTITTPTIASKVYDGTAVSGAVTLGTLSGFVSSETVTATAAGTYPNADVGTQTATITYTLANGTNGGLATNYSLANGTASGTITAKQLTITGVTANNKIYDGSTTATLNTGSAALVGLIAGDNVNLSTPSTSGSFADQFVGVTKPVTASGFSLTGTQKDRDNYTLLQPTGLTANITPKAASVVVAPKTKVYGSSDPILTGTLTGFITADAVTAAYSRVAGETVSGGPYAITAVLSPSGVLSNYTITNTPSSLTITKANAVVTVSGYTGVYDALAHGATGTASGVGGVDLSAGLNLGATFTNVPGGTATWTYTDASGNYNNATGTAAIVISKATATLAWVPGTLSQIYDGSVKTVVATTTPSGLTVNYSFTGTPQNVGSYPVIATINDTNYQGSLNGTLVIISPATITTVASSLNPSVYGQSVTFTATITSLGGTPDNATVTFFDGATNIGSSSSTAGVASISTSALNAGSHNITATYAGAGIFLSSTSGVLSQVVNKANAVVTVNGYTGVYDAAAHGATGSAAGVAGDPSAAGSALTLGATFTDVPGGTANWTFSGGTNYNDQSGTAAIVITKANQTITWANPADITYGTLLSATQLNATVAGVSGGSAPGVLTYPVNEIGDLLNVQTGGFLQVFAAATSNYNAANKTVFINVIKADQTITWANPADITYGTSLSATQLNATVAGVSGGTAPGALTYAPVTGTVLNAGASQNLQVDAAATSNYNAATKIVQINVNKAASVTTVTINGGPFTYTGSAQTPATVSVTGAGGLSLTPAPVYASNINAGTASASYNFTGDANHEASSDSKNFTIGKANATIVVTPYSVTYNASAHTATGTATGVSSEALAGLDLSGTTHTNAGTYGSDAWTFTDVTGNYNDDSGTVSDAIGKADAVIVVTPYSVTYNAASHTATGTATGVSSEALAGLDLSGTTHTNAGTYGSDAWTFTDVAGNFNDDSGTVSDAIGKADAVIVVTPYSVTYNAASHTATGTATGVSLEALAGLDLSGTTHTNAGTYGSDAWTFTDVTGNYNDDSGTVSDAIGKADALVTVTGYTGVYDAAAHGATSTVVGVALDPTAAGSSINLGASFTNVPGGTASWTFTGGTNYNDQSGTAAIVINKADAVVTVTGYTGVYDAAAHGATSTIVGVALDPTAAGSSINLGASFTNVPGGTASWTFTGGTNYNDQSGTAAIVITTKSASVLVASKTKVYGSGDPILTGTLSGFEPADGVTASYSRVPGETVLGSPYAITAVLNPSSVLSNYNITNTPSTLSITPLTVTVTADAKTKIYGQADPALTFVSSPAVGSALANGDLIIFTGALSRAAGETVLGSPYAIAQNTIANSNYAITYVGANLSITPLSVTVTADAKTKIYGQVDPALTFVSSPAVGSLLANGNAISFTGALSRVAGENVGSYAINQGSVGNSNYTISYTGANLSITPLSVTVTADAKTKIYGQVDPALTFVSSPVVGSLLANGNAISFTGALSRVAGENVGSYAINQSSVGNSNYTISYTGANLSITPLSVTVSAVAKTKVFGTADPALTYTSSPAVGTLLANGQLISFTGALTRVAGESATPPGTYAIQQNSVNNTNYTIAYVGANLTITNIPILASLSAGAILCNGGTTTLTVTASGGDGALQYNLNGGAYQSSNLFTVGAGNYTVIVKDADGFTVTRTIIVGQPTALTTTFTTNNAWLYFGYSGDQTATITAKPSGGTAPYKVVITMDRALVFNYVTSAGDEIWTPAAAPTGGTVTNSGITGSTSCSTSPFAPILGCYGSVPTTTATNIQTNGSYSVNVTLLKDAGFTVTVTDANGCIVSSSYLTGGSPTTSTSPGGRIDAEDVRCFAGNSTVVKVTLCHRTGSTKNPCVTICVDENAVADHLAHGDYMGSCLNNCATPAANAKMAGTQVDSNTEFATAEAFPNPFTSTISVVITNPYNESVSMNVIDITGRVLNVKQSAPDAEGIITMETADLAKGMHFLRVNIGKFTKTIKIMKE